jgi:hypothetical protein
MLAETPKPKPTPSVDCGEFRRPWQPRFWPHRSRDFTASNALQHRHRASPPRLTRCPVDDALSTFSAPSRHQSPRHLQGLDWTRRQDIVPRQRTRTRADAWRSFPCWRNNEKSSRCVEKRFATVLQGWAPPISAPSMPRSQTLVCLLNRQPELLELHAQPFPVRHPRPFTVVQVRARALRCGKVFSVMPTRHRLR